MDQATVRGFPVGPFPEEHPPFPAPKQGYPLGRNSDQATASR